MNGDDLVRFLEERPVDREEVADGRCGGGGEGPGAHELLVEEVVRYVDALPEGFVAEDDAERDDRNAKPVGDAGRNVGRAIGNDANGQAGSLRASIQVTGGR